MSVLVKTLADAGRAATTKIANKTAAQANSGRFISRLLDLFKKPSAGIIYSLDCCVENEFLTSRCSRYGSFIAFDSGVLKIIMAIFCDSKAGQFGTPLWFGLPVRAKVVHAKLMTSDSAYISFVKLSPISVLETSKLR